MINITDQDVIKRLGLSRVKKYLKYASQVEIKLDWLYNWILVSKTFIKNLGKIYYNKN